MLVEERHAREGLVALETLVLLDIAVGLHVRAQVRSVGKGARAYITLEWLFARVSAHMSLEEPWPRKAFATNFALTRQGVGTNVHLQGAQRGVRLVTVLAGELLLDLCSAVELLVLAQAAIR